MQVNGVIHHRVVDEDQSQALAMVELDRAIDFRELFAVERPHVTFHIAGKVQFHLAFGRALVGPASMLCNWE